MGEKRHQILLYPEPKLVLQLVALRFLRKLEKCGFCAFYDADGTLFYALPTWLKYLNEAWGTDYKPEDVISYDFSNLKPPHPDMPSALEVLGPVCRDPEIQLGMETMPGVEEALGKISNLGIPSVVCTKRPIDVYRATKEALRNNRIPFDLLILSNEKVELALALRCAFSVEDDPFYAEEFAKAGILSLLMDARYNQGVNKRVIRVLGWREIVNIAKAVLILTSGAAFLL